MKGTIFFIWLRGIAKRVHIKRIKNMSARTIHKRDHEEGKQVYHATHRTPFNQRDPYALLLPRYKRDLSSTGSAATVNTKRLIRIVVGLISFRLMSQYMK